MKKDKKKLRGFPKTLFAHRDNAGTKDEYLNIEPRLEDIMDANEFEVVAEYHLVRVFEAKKRVTVDER